LQVRLITRSAASGIQKVRIRRAQPAPRSDAPRDPVDGLVKPSKGGRDGGRLRSRCAPTPYTNSQRRSWARDEPTCVRVHGEYCRRRPPPLRPDVRSRRRRPEPPHHPARPTESGQATCAQSTMATGAAAWTETALHRSTSGLTFGSFPSCRRRRSNASAAQRICVGCNPISEYTRRQAWISGHCPSDTGGRPCTSPSLSRFLKAVTCAMTASSKWSAPRTPRTCRTPALRVGNADQRSGVWEKCVVNRV